MIRLLHTADWHLGKRLGRFERLSEQQRALESLLHYADEEKADVVLIAGDIFDTANPSAEAQSLFYSTLSELSRKGERPVIVVAGNHDSPERLEAAAPWGQPLGILLLGFPESIPPPAGSPLGHGLISASAPGCIVLQHPRWRYPLRILLTPYTSAYRLAQLPENLGEWLRHFWNRALQVCCPEETAPTVLVAHLYCRSADGQIFQEDEEEKPIIFGGTEPLPPDIFPESVDYIALGHLHRLLVLRSDRPSIVYAGSLLQYSFSDPETEKSAVLVELSPSTAPRWQRLPLRGGYPLRRLQCFSVDEALSALTHHTEAYVELTLNLEQALSAEDYQQLWHAHPRLVRLLPTSSTKSSPPPPLPEIAQGFGSSEEHFVTLFTAFFRSRKRMDPDPALQELFREILREHRNRSTLP